MSSSRAVERIRVAISPLYNYQDLLLRSRLNGYILTYLQQEGVL
jgi:hypothetical protein